MPINQEHLRAAIREAHPVEQPIAEIIVTLDDYQHSTMGIAYAVGMDGVTRIEATVKGGEYAFIPYFRVWRDNECLLEISQHKIVSVRFGAPENQENYGSDGSGGW